jgi:heme/copper-type cytochrome/quinol oxidase subunit 2
LADLTTTKPHTVEQKGMGPGFWALTAGLTVLNVAVGIYIVYGNLDYLLPAWVNPVSDRAADIDDLMKFMGVFGFAIFAYVTGYVVYFAIVFRRRADEPATTIGVQIHDAPALEFWWTAIPTLLLAVLVVLTIIVWQRIQFPKVAPALTMEVVAHQFDFEFRYPGVTGSLYSPKDEMH